MPVVTPNRNYSASSSRSISSPKVVNTTRRIQAIYSILLCLSAVFIIRLFYLQVIKHDHYRKSALLSQLKEYEIPAERGTIMAYDGDEVTPLVLNEKKYTLFADPQYVKDPENEAAKVAAIVGGDINILIEKLKTPDTRYVILAKKLTKEQSDRIGDLELKGIGTREESYRTYPQGTLAAQLLGFVNEDRAGQYGLEEFLDNKLKGKSGQLKAITDARGVPLVANKDNVVVDPTQGDKLQLTLDIGLQRQLEDILKAGLDKARSSSGSAIIMEVKTGAIKAMANYPSYDPNNITALTDLGVLSNPVVSSPLEVGSIMKPLTMAAALDKGVVNMNSTFYDHSRVDVDDITISNIEEDGGPGEKGLRDILQLSLNTGAVYLLQQMGGGEVNETARKIWHDYMTNHYGFGKDTGVEQSGEVGGTVPDPIEGYGRNIQYANSAFGQGITATLMQMTAALGAVLNDGKYVQPHLLESTISSSGEKEIVETKIVRQTVSAATSQNIIELMKYVFEKNHVLYGLPNPREGYIYGGKTGTAQVAKPEGGYYEDRFNGTFSGFVGGDKPEYVILVRVNEPQIAGYAGSRAAAPIFSNLANMMIDNFGVTPKKL